MYMGLTVLTLKLLCAARKFFLFKIEKTTYLIGYITISKQNCVARSSLLVIDNYTIAQVIFAFWLVLAYDLLKDRRTIDVIITKFFLLHFKMAERFKN